MIYKYEYERYEIHFSNKNILLDYFIKNFFQLLLKNITIFKIIYSKIE